MNISNEVILILFKFFLAASQVNIMIFLKTKSHFGVNPRHTHENSSRSKKMCKHLLIVVATEECTEYW